MGVLRANVDGEWVIVSGGPPGGGGANEAFEFFQTTPAEVWIVNHNLGYKPDVEVLDAGGNKVIAQVLHISVNQFQVLVNPAMSGLARAS